MAAPPGQGLGTLAHYIGVSQAGSVLWINKAFQSSVWSTEHNSQDKNLINNLFWGDSVCIVLMLSIYLRQRLYFREEYVGDFTTNLPFKPSDFRSKTVEQLKP